jgi:hypothetical protein
MTAVCQQARVVAASPTRRKTTGSAIFFSKSAVQTAYLGGSFASPPQKPHNFTIRLGELLEASLCMNVTNRLIQCFHQNRGKGVALSPVAIHQLDLAIFAPGASYVGPLGER